MWIFANYKVCADSRLVMEVFVHLSGSAGNVSLKEDAILLLAKKKAFLTKFWLKICLPREIFPVNS
jgi:hypothetical protein